MKTYSSIIECEFKNSMQLEWKKKIAFITK